MKIHDKRTPALTVYRFSQLLPGNWYLGVETGNLYLCIPHPQAASACRPAIRLVRVAESVCDNYVVPDQCAGGNYQRVEVELNILG